MSDLGTSDPVIQLFQLWDDATMLENMEFIKYRRTMKSEWGWKTYFKARHSRSLRAHLERKGK